MVTNTKSGDNNSNATKKKKKPIIRLKKCLYILYNDSIASIMFKYVLRLSNFSSANLRDPTPI